MEPVPVTLNDFRNYSDRVATALMRYDDGRAHPEAAIQLNELIILTDIIAAQVKAKLQQISNQNIISSPPQYINPSQLPIIPPLTQPPTSLGSTVSHYVRPPVTMPNRPNSPQYPAVYAPPTFNIPPTFPPTHYAPIIRNGPNTNIVRGTSTRYNVPIVS